MGHTFAKHGASMHLCRLRLRLASPLTEVKSTKFGKVDMVNTELSGKMVKMLCAPYKNQQSPIKFLEALDTDMIVLNANLAACGNAHLQRIGFEFGEFAANSFGQRTRSEFALKFTALQIQCEFGLRIR